ENLGNLFFIMDSEIVQVSGSTIVKQQVTSSVLQKQFVVLVESQHLTKSSCCRDTERRNKGQIMLIPPRPNLESKTIALFRLGITADNSQRPMKLDKHKVPQHLLLWQTNKIRTEHLVRKVERNNRKTTIPPTIINQPIVKTLSQRLHGFSLSDKEHNLIDIANDDIKIIVVECQRSMFGKIIGERKTSWMGLKRAMSNIWKLKEPMEIKELGHNFFQFIFQNKEDLER
ncbi:Unknown protein, partial [Striga hermonthica]